MRSRIGVNSGGYRCAPLRSSLLFVPQIDGKCSRNLPGEEVTFFFLFFFFSFFLSFFLSFILILHSLFIWPFSFSSVLLFSMYFLLGWPLGFSFSWFLFCWLPAQVKAAEMEGNSVATVTGRWGTGPDRRSEPISAQTFAILPRCRW